MKLRGTWFTVFWRCRSLSSDQRGFTLAELLVALTIFAVGLLAIAKMQIVAIQMNSRTSRTTSSSMMTYGVLEEILSLPGSDARFRVLAAGMVWDMDAKTTGVQVSRVVGVSSYSAVYSVAPNLNDNTSMVTVIVTGDGRNSSATGFKNLGLE